MMNVGLITFSPLWLLLSSSWWWWWWNALMLFFLNFRFFFYLRKRREFSKGVSIGVTINNKQKRTQCYFIFNRWNINSKWLFSNKLNTITANRYRCKQLNWINNPIGIFEQWSLILLSFGNCFLFWNDSLWWTSLKCQHHVNRWIFI